MDIFDELGIDVTDEGTINAINMYSQLRQVTRDLVKIRKERGLRQQDIADELMISRQAVAKIEDPSGNPKISTLITYAIAVDAAIEIKVKKRQGLVDEQLPQVPNKKRQNQQTQHRDKHPVTNQTNPVKDR